MAKNILNIPTRGSRKTSDHYQVQVVDLGEWFDTLLSVLRRREIVGFSHVVWDAMEQVVMKALKGIAYHEDDCLSLYQRRLTGDADDLAMLAQETIDFFDRYIRTELASISGWYVVDFNATTYQLSLYPEALTYNKQRELSLPTLPGFEQFLKNCEREGQQVPREVWRLLRDYAAETQTAERVAPVY